MSQETVEVVRRIYDAARRRDAEAVYGLYDPEVELDNSRLGFVEGGVFQGHDGLRNFFRNWHDAWEGIDYDFDELIDAGQGRVLAVVTRRGRGRLSGADVRWRLALVWTVHGGKVTRLVWFPSPEEAFETVGLSE